MNKKKYLIFSRLLVLILSIVFIFMYADLKFVNAEDQKGETIELDNQAMKNVINSNEDTFVYFYQPTCSFCIEAALILDEILKEKDITLYRIDISKESNLKAWDQYEINGTPSIIKFRDGNEVNRIEGLTDKEAYIMFFEGKL
ncbi:thioredoxin family protein [Bacillus manliponensis]|uniref:thioredoxin family protein n=1 Tax=Bacillus manliponensis TaxID=574376 RepID=UPI00068DE97D|nr:thioredoxin family protein [Bacillus manliponensis]